MRSDAIPGSPHGGDVIIGICDDGASEIDTRSNTEFAAEAFPSLSHKKPLIVCSIYRPTDNNTYYANNIYKSLVYPLHMRYMDRTVWIGDANLPDINWSDDIGCEQIVNFPTHGNIILDIFLTSRPTIVIKNSPIPGLSNHDIVLIETNSVPSYRHKFTKRVILRWKSANITAIHNALHNFSSSFVSLVAFPPESTVYEPS